MIHWSEVEEVVRFLKLNVPSLKKTVIQDQLKAMGVTLVGEKKYSVETTVRAFEYFALSRATYYDYERTSNFLVCLL